MGRQTSKPDNSPEKPGFSSNWSFKSIVRYMVSATRDYLRPRFWALLIPLLIILAAGNIITSDGLKVLVFVAAYALVSLLFRVFVKDERK
jgi:hypothetical protein